MDQLDANELTICCFSFSSTREKKYHFDCLSRTHVSTVMRFEFSKIFKRTDSEPRTTTIPNKAHYTTLGARLTMRVVHVYLVFRSVWPSTNQWHGFLRWYASAHARQRVEQAPADRKLVIAVTDNSAFLDCIGIGKIRN